MTPDDRELAQHWIMKLYLRERKLDARADWGRTFRREQATGIVRQRPKKPRAA